MKRRLYSKICIFCKKEFKPFYHYQRLCSNTCSGLWRTSHLRHKKICKYCNKEFVTKKRRNQFYCSRKCYLFSRTQPINLKCIICGKIRKVKASEFKRGTPKYCSKKCQGIGLSKQYKGENNPFFKDGKSVERAIERDGYRNSLEYKNFVRAVFVRDKNQCQICGKLRKRFKDGKGKNNNLTVHHIKSWKEYPIERFNPENGICLCNNCHKIIHKQLSKGIIPKESKNYVKKYNKLKEMMK